MTDLNDLAERTARMEGAIEEIRDAVKDIARAITSIALLEQKHADLSASIGRAFEAQAKQEDRLALIEQALPILKLTSKWVISGTIGVVALVGAGVLVLVLKLPT